jgi:HPr kinase/phosphorylase
MTEPERRTATVAELFSPELEDLHLSLVAGREGLDRPILWTRIQRPGLALAGFLPFIKPGRVQVVGETELTYLETLSAAERGSRLAAIASLPVAAFVLTKGHKPPTALVAECRRNKIPLFTSPETTSRVIEGIIRLLEDRLAPVVTLHGVLVDVFGMGVLLQGESGIGKSECALDLIERGHRLVADDVVQIKRYPSGLLVGQSTDLIRYHMELRGIGIINIKHLFGVSAVRGAKSIEIVIQLERWNPAQQYDRLGLDGEVTEILGATRPLIRVPVASGRPLSILVEIAARNALLKRQGYDAAREFAQRVDEEIDRNRKKRRA